MEDRPRRSSSCPSFFCTRFADESYRVRSMYDMTTVRFGQ